MNIALRFLRLLSILLMLMLFPATIIAVPLAAPVDREITDIQGRTLSASIIAVTPETITVLRKSDQLSFDLPLSTLSEADRNLAAKLLAETLANPIFPDNPWLQTIRQDLRIFDPGTRRLIPLPPSFTRTQSWVIIAVDAFISNAPSRQRFARLKHSPKPRDVLFLWLGTRGSALGIELEGETLPPHAAIISYDALRQAKKITDMVAQEASDQRSARAQSSSRRSPEENPNPFYITPDERASLTAMILRRLPSYWPRPPYHTDIDPNSSADSTSLYPYVYLYRRNGTPAKHQGSPVLGKLEDVLRLLSEKPYELE